MPSGGTNSYFAHTSVAGLVPNPLTNRKKIETRNLVIHSPISYYLKIFFLFFSIKSPWDSLVSKNCPITMVFLQLPCLAIKKKNINKWWFTFHPLNRIWVIFAHFGDGLVVFVFIICLRHMMKRVKSSFWKSLPSVFISSLMWDIFSLKKLFGSHFFS